MNRRTLLRATLAAPLAAACFPAAYLPARAATAWRRFEVTTRISLPAGGPAQLWLPVAHTAPTYQRATDPTWQSTGAARLTSDPRTGAPILHASWSDASAPTLQAVQIIATRDRGLIDQPTLSAADRALWTAPTASVPTDGIVRATAERITAGATSPRDRARRLYDWVVDTTWRNPETQGCGTGDFKQMLETNQFGGKCADINGLMVGLARAAGLPARDIYGIRVADSRQFRALGKSGDISKAQHCRAEIHLDGEGWLPVDPADVRKVVLEEKLPIDHPDVAALRERLFGSWEMNWIGYNSANDITLPGAEGQHGNFSFLMYPCAVSPSGLRNCVDPNSFHYDIAARELAT